MGNAVYERSEAMHDLLDLMEKCRKLDAEIRFSARNRNFTVMVWQGWDAPDPKNHAKAIQTQVKELAKQYPRVTCYCFDDFSTLLYVV